MAVFNPKPGNVIFITLTGRGGGRMTPPWRLEITKLIPKMEVPYESMFKRLQENAIGIAISYLVTENSFSTDLGVVKRYRADKANICPL